MQISNASSTRTIHRGSKVALISPAWVSWDERNAKYNPQFLQPGEYTVWAEGGKSGNGIYLEHGDGAFWVSVWKID